ncbi:DUF362 domain-containing protein [Sorangium sp. So ce341]|uniref:DUF362 domain-containing protein n=1 Tax=unclassified Sorangium TaxID=2621164 RepID=UPI003F646D45
MGDISRREVLRRLGAAGLVLGGAAGVAAARWDRGGTAAAAAERQQTRDYRLRDAPAGVPQLVVARAGAEALAGGAPDPAALVRKAVDALGGMRRFISRGDVVVVKPNIGWDRTPIHAANTNPKVVAEVVRLAYDAGAKSVIVTDASCNEPNRCFQRSGIWKAAYDVGAEVVIPAAHRFRGMRLKGEVLDDWPVYTPLVNADKVINVPIAKHHNLSKYTAAMKNWYGALGGRRNRLHQNIDVSIADLATFIQPTLTIVDAVRVLMRNGPQGGNVADAKDMHTVIATTDQVAADAYGCQLIGRKPEEIPYLKMGHERGLGTMHWQNLRLAEV